MNDIKTVIEILAIAFAGGFFLYKVLNGLLVVNLSLSLNCERMDCVNSPGFDLLIVRLKLKKGSNSSITIKIAQVKITFETDTMILEFPGTRRSIYHEKRSSIQSEHLEWSKQDRKSPNLRLISDEETQLATHFMVPSQSVCTIEVVVVGDRPVSFMLGQWKASDVSPPRSAAVKIEI